MENEEGKVKDLEGRTSSNIYLLAVLEGEIRENKGKYIAEEITKIKILRTKERRMVFI